MKKETKKLAWEYFIDQKITEIGIVLIVVLGLTLLVMVPLCFGHFIASWLGLDNDNLVGNWFWGFIFSLIAFVILIWLDNNWIKAVEKAKKHNPKKRK